MKLPCLAAFILSAAIAGAASAAEPAGDTNWYGIFTEGGAQIGDASQQIVQKPEGREIIASQEADVLEEVPPATPLSPSDTPKTDHMSWRTVTTEDKAGRTIAISSHSQIGPDWRHNGVDTEARIEGATAEITRETPVETRKATIALPPNVRFDGGDALLPAWNPLKSTKLEFDDFNIDAMTVDHMVIEATSGAAPDAQGRIAVLRKRFAGGSLVAISRLLLDSHGQIVEVTQPMFGASLIIRATDRKTAQASHPPFRVLVNVMVKSPYLISASALDGHIRYRFAFRDGIEFPIPQTGEQRVTPESGFSTLDICADCGPGMGSDRATLDDALKPTVWLQSDDPKLKAIADPIAKLDISGTQKMKMLLEKAKPYLGTVDFTGHYSALETMSRHASDCTDAAVLLAALGRAAGIPTRVANGLVYSRESYHGVANVFMPHSWTLAFVDGKWTSFDLALDNFDASHIALTVGDGDERSVAAASQLAGLLQWETLAEIRAQPAN